MSTKVKNNQANVSIDESKVNDNIQPSEITSSSSQDNLEVSASDTIIDITQANPTIDYQIVDNVRMPIIDVTSKSFQDYMTNKFDSIMPRSTECIVLRDSEGKQHLFHATLEGDQIFGKWTIKYNLQIKGRTYHEVRKVTSNSGTVNMYSSSQPFNELFEPSTQKTYKNVNQLVNEYSIRTMNNLQDTDQVFATMLVLITTLTKDEQDHLQHIMKKFTLENIAFAVKSIAASINMNQLAKTEAFNLIDRYVESKLAEKLALTSTDNHDTDTDDSQSTETDSQASETESQG